MDFIRINFIFFFFVVVAFQSLIMVKFREPMTLEKNLIAWELWSDRQHSTKTRILDIGKFGSVIQSIL